MRNPVISTGVFALLRRRSGEIPAFLGCGNTFSLEQKNAGISPPPLRRASLAQGPVEMTTVEGKGDLGRTSLAVVAVVDGALAAFKGSAIFTVSSQNGVVELDGLVVVTVAGEFIGIGDQALDLVGGVEDVGG
jgi:hypothetical protein